MDLEPAFLPFTDEAKRFVEGHGHGLDDLIGDDDLEPVRLRARDRLLQSLDGRVETPPDLGADPSQGAVSREALSYPLSRVMASCLGDRFLLKRLVEAEAKRCADYVEERSDPAEQLAEMGIRISDRGVDAPLAPGDVADGAESSIIRVTDFLGMTGGLPGDEWRLVNRRVSGGYVALADGEPLTLFREAARMRMEENLPLAVTPGICEPLSKYLGPVRETLDETHPYGGELRLDESCFPPCMEVLIEGIKKGEGIPHTARFAVTAFLRTVGVSMDEIVDMYDTFPDFDEEKTRYQVEHISGDSSGTEYLPPGCGTMRTYGNCPEQLMDSRCRADTVTHPLSYYRWALRESDSEGEHPQTGGEKPPSGD